MKHHVAHALAALLFVAALVAPHRPGTRAEATAPLQVIVGGASGPSDISLTLLRRAFSGEAAEYAAGKRLVPFNLPTGTHERQVFDRVVLGLEPADVGRFWINRRIRDEGLPPRTLPSAEFGVRVVASFPGAVTYVSANVVAPNVRVLKIDGKSPADPGYVFAGR